MELSIQIGVQVVFAGIVAAIAHSRGRNPVGWFFIGLFFTCLGLILVLVLADLKKDEAAKSRLRAENKRLRETVRKDRMVADSRHEATSRRLTTHDRAIGVDTGGFEELGEGSAPPPIETIQSGPSVEESNWYFAVGDDREGPVSFEELRDMWLGETIDKGTLVWRKGQPDWLPLDRISDLLAALST